MKLMDKMLYTVFAFQLLIVCFFSILSLKWMEENKGQLQYLDINDGKGLTRFITQFFTYWVAYSHMIPISLYVIIEMLKLLQTKLINNDVKMFFVEDMQYGLCRNSDLIEELGQVEFVFSDKTGTLTQNKMEFKKCQAADTVWGNPTSEDLENGIGENEGMRQSAVQELQECLTYYQKYFINTDERNRAKIIEKNPPPEWMPQNLSEIYMLFRLLSVCHTVVVDKDVETGEI